MAAHALKGSIATVGAPAGREAAAELEQMGRENRFDGAAVAYRRLREELVASRRSICGRRPRPARGAFAEIRPPQQDIHAQEAELIVTSILVVDDDRATREVLRSVLDEGWLHRRRSRATASRRSR